MATDEQRAYVARQRDVWRRAHGARPASEAAGAAERAAAAAAGSNATAKEIVREVLRLMAAAAIRGQGERLCVDVPLSSNVLVTLVTPVRAALREVGLCLGSREEPYPGECGHEGGTDTVYFAYPATQRINYGLPPPVTSASGAGAAARECR